MPRVVFATFSGQKDLGRRGQHTDLSKILHSVVGRQGAREPGFVAIAEKVQNTDHMATTTVRARRAKAWYRCS